MKRFVVSVFGKICALLAPAILSSTVFAGNIYLDNASFESPPTPYANIVFAGWQKTPQPSYWDNSGGFYWVQTTGIFANTAPTNSDYIGNMDGAQAAFIFADPSCGIFQDNVSVDSLGASNTFNAVFTVGKSYHLVMGVIGGDGGMTEGTSLQLSLYYRDASNNIVTVAATNIIYYATNFPNITNFVDCSVTLPVVKATDAWAGKNMGVEILSTGSSNLAGGYWDVDNLRLSESIYVPGYSFETPTNSYASPNIDYWQKSAKPAYYDESGGFLWVDLTGEFLNTPAGSSDSIPNCVGNQVGYVFADPQVAIFQDYQTIYGSNTVPMFDFNAKYEIGKAYNLTIGLICGGGGMLPGVPFQLSLYYRDASNNMATTVLTNIIYTTNVFKDTVTLVDCNVHLPTVKPTDAWAGKNIGISLASGADFSNAGGYWDIDNVRLNDVVDPKLTALTASNHQFTFSLTSEPNTKFQLLTTTSLPSAASNWTSLGTFTNITGSLPYTDANATLQKRFYRAQLVP